jgi:hypothetical protein
MKPRGFRESFENLYSNKLENLELGKHLHGYDLPKLNQNDLNHFNRFIASIEMEAVIKSLPRKKSPGPMDSLLNSTRP